jgi:NaMN:DMB phosphoribosyltransferase
VAFAATNGGHFLPYMWLHRTRAYAVLAVVCALGPFAVLLVAGAATAFHATGFLVGGVMLAVAASIWTLRERGVAH